MSKWIFLEVNLKPWINYRIWIDFSFNKFVKNRINPGIFSFSINLIELMPLFNGSIIVYLLKNNYYYGN